jgi:hypothetical protein
MVPRLNNDDGYGLPSLQLLNRDIFLHLAVAPSQSIEKYWSWQCLRLFIAYSDQFC